MEVALLRITISGLAFLPFFVYHIGKLDIKRWPVYLLIAMTGSGIPAILYANAQTELSSATTGILNSLTPLFTLLLSLFAFKNPTTGKQIGGVILGLIGAVLLISTGNSSSGQNHVHIIPALLVALGCLLYATNVNLIKAWFQEVRPIHISSFSFTLLGIPCLLFIPLTEIVPKLQNDPSSWYSLAAVSTLAVVSTFLAILVFYKLVQDTSPVFASSVAYLMPVIALGWGWIDGEKIGSIHILSLLLILYGVYLSRLRKSATSS